jgi:hypothetical protein
MTDWRRNEKLLHKDSKRLIRALVAEHEKRREPLAAIGYVFEFGRGQLYFDLCANTAHHAQTSLVEYLAEYPDASADEFRWNSGGYDYPGAAGQHGGDWSEQWWEELERLDLLAACDKKSERVHAMVARICCKVLVDLARRGVIGDWKQLDFNVATLLDDVAQIKERDRLIRRLIALNPAWQTPTVVSLAHAASDNRTLPAGTLEPDRLAILADALEEAGCENADILSQLREPGVQGRRCWPLDLLLGKW